MTLTVRTLEVIPDKLLQNGPKGLHYVENVNKISGKVSFLTAYRKSNGPDKHLRILTLEKDIMGDPDLGLYYQDIVKSERVTLNKPVDMVLIENLMRSKSLTQFLLEEHLTC